MSFEQFIPFIPWDFYSKKIKNALTYPYLKGVFEEGEAKERGIRFSSVEKGSKTAGSFYKLFFLVDPEDGVIVDVRYIFFGSTLLQAVLEIGLQFLIGKNYDQARRITEEVLEKELGVKKEGRKGSLFMKVIPFVLDGIYEACLSFQDIPLSISYKAPPQPFLKEGAGLVVDNFMELSLKEKLTVIEGVLDTDIRPYIAMDGGGIEVLNLIDKELIIAYQGNCTSCFSSVGATLSYIQETLQTRVHPELFVTPQL